MRTFFQSLGQAMGYILNIGWTDVVDILIVAGLIYVLINLIRRTRTYRVFQGILILLVALWLSDIARLHTLNYILRNTMQLGLLALVILFQPELRRFLERLGTGRAMANLFGKGVDSRSTEAAITQIVMACADLSASRTGALIIFERDNPLDDQIRTGTVIDADTTAELLKNLFYDKAPLHDGAVIIRGGRIQAAGCMLPLSNNNNLSKDLGMRHRAGIGMSEVSDALVAIVSEESGSISVASDGMLKRHLSTETFEKLLRSELMRDEEEAESKGILTRFMERTKK
ncbi:MAG: diadenylate cyclase CdaA [Oscillospiraceae bacterium]|nr:diadenylate cyclase CdaA [Oscillospiraceae bacterium]